MPETRALVAMGIVQSLAGILFWIHFARRRRRLADPSPRSSASGTLIGGAVFLLLSIFVGMMAANAVTGGEVPCLQKSRHCDQAVYAASREPVAYGISTAILIGGSAFLLFLAAACGTTGVEALTSGPSSRSLQ